MPSQRGRVILIGLTVVTLASLWRAIAVEQAKRHLEEDYAKVQQMKKQLEEERTSLDHELADTRQTLQERTGSLTTLQQQYQDLQTRLNKTLNDFASLQHKHDALRQQNASLKDEKQQLEAKLSSLKELRLAIHDVKRKLAQERLAAWRAHIQALKDSDQERLASGNHGFVVREGASTLVSSGSKLRVHVLEPQSQ